MKILVIGGTGHIGSFLVPMLAKEAWRVIVTSRGKKEPGKEAPWEKVERLVANYSRGDRNWRDTVAEVKAEVIIDILGTDVPTTYDAAKGTCKHYIACGSIWMFGPPRIVPTPEITQGPCEISKPYAIRYQELLDTRKRARTDGVAFTAIMPPNICGPGKIPLEARGGRDIEVHRAHAAGEPVSLPIGCNTLIGPCDAVDVAQGFFLSVHNRDAAAGEIFNVGSGYSLTATQFIQTYAEIYKTDIPIEFVPPREFFEVIMPAQGANFHFREHMLPDISKIRAKLGYQPQFTPEETMERGVNWMRKHKLL